MKKAILFLVIAAMILAVPCFAQETEDDIIDFTEPSGTIEIGDTEDMANGMVGAFSWSLEGSTLKISGSGAMEELDGDAPWYPFREEITKVEFSGGVTYVCAGAFSDYDTITEVDFGDAMYELGSRSFYDCDGLTTLSMPDTFKVFGEECLRGCSRLKEIHCAGRFPSFRLNCLWDSYVKIYFPVNKPWGIEYIQQLEEAFHGRIEFLASDGSDPYAPTEETEETTQPTEETTTPTEETTEPVITEPVITEPPTTEAPTAPTTVPTTPWSVPETIQTEPTAAEAEESVSSAGAWVAVALAVLVASLLGIGGVIFLASRKKGKYSR